MSFTLSSVLASEMQEYLALLEGAERDTESYVGTFKSLDAFYVQNKIHEKVLTDEIVWAWLRTLTCRPQSKNYAVCRLRKFARYLAVLGIPACEPDLFRALSTHLPYTFTDEEFSAIIAAADDYKANAIPSETSFKFPVMLRVLYGCGLRTGEALALQWDDVDFEEGIITIKWAKNNKQRRVPIKQSLTDILFLYRQRRFPDCTGKEFLFSNSDKNGEPYLNNTFRDWFIRVLRQAKISNERTSHLERCISPHSLRHYFTFNSFLQAESQGFTLEEIAPYLSTYLGHTSFYGTEKYLTTDYTMYTGTQERVANAIGGVFPEVHFE